MKNELLKFRVWDYKRKKMIYYEGVFNQRPYTETSTFPQYDSSPKYYDLEVMRFTGMTNREGDEIYELDLIKGKHGLGRVIYDRRLAVFLYEWAVGKNDYLWEHIDDCEKLGNLLEHPEVIQDDFISKFQR